MFKVKFRRASAVQWANTTIILEAGEPGYAWDTGVFKVGNGYSKWPELQGYTTYADMLIAVEAAVATAIIDDSGAHVELEEHINSPTPHPVYDDGPSLDLLYLNAKV